MDNLTNDVMNTMKARSDDDNGLELPPKVFLDMEGEILHMDDTTQSLKAKFPVKTRYQNPLKYMQGGMIVAAIDNTVGPLSFMVAPPSVTSQINTTFIRPVTPNDEFIFIEAQVTERTRRQLFITATVTNAEGKVLTLCHVTCAILGDR